MTQVNSDNHARVGIPMSDLEQQSYSEKACKKVYNLIDCHLFLLRIFFRDCLTVVVYSITFRQL
jgi:hypothetical protein